jgi:hypothetical protein
LEAFTVLMAALVTLWQLRKLALCLAFHAVCLVLEQSDFFSQELRFSSWCFVTSSY